MLRKLRRPSHSTVVAYLALFVALGGTGAYAANTIGSADVIDESLLSQDVKNGEVKSSDLGTNSVTSSRIATGNVFNSDLATDAVNSAKVAANTLTASDIGPDSVTGSELKEKPGRGVLVGEGWHEVGAAGEPKFNYDHGTPRYDDSYVNLDPTKYNTAAFYKDPLGIVHLKGAITPRDTTLGASCDSHSIFQLPAGYRP